MTQPRILHTHLWDGRNLPDWLTGHHHWNGNQLVIQHPDGTTPIHPGWIIAYWSDGTCTTGSPATAARVYGPAGMHGQLERARQLHQQTCPLARGLVGAGFDCAMCDTLDGPEPEPGPHVYLSTGCWHGDHDYCQSNTGLNGSKRPASCKFCAAPCQCFCHAT